MDKNQKYLTIHKFSELTQTSIDTLKHYDKIGLLKPAYTGENHYRYYLPEQSLSLTRILFGKNAGIPLKEIRDFIVAEDPEAVIQKYKEISHKLNGNVKETQSILNTINNFSWYYGFSKRYPIHYFFQTYLPEWFIIQSSKAKIGKSFESSESDIANKLFLKNFADEKWPHYLLQALVMPEDIKSRNFNELSYFLKMDKPELHEKDTIHFIPNGVWICMLFYTQGKHIARSIEYYLDQLDKQNKAISGPLFIMDIVNCLITPNPKEYCTMIYARDKEQPYEEY